MIFKKLRASSSIFMATIMFMTSATFADTYKVNSESVNVRKTASTDATVIGKVNTGKIVEVEETSNDWKKIRFENGYGWIYAKFLKAVDKKNTVETKKAVVQQGNVVTNGFGINVRSGPSKDNSVLACLYKGIKLTVLEKSNGWTKVKTASGIEGWVLSTLLSPYSETEKSTKTSTQKSTKAPIKAPTKSSRGGSDISSARASDVRSKIVVLAKEYLGVKYVYGGSGPGGFDCSGFSKYVLKQYGYSLDRVASEQSGNGEDISKSELLPGDLVFFDTNGRRDHINHVGIYIGSDQMIHASSGSHKVMVSNIDEGFYSRAFMKARRIINK